jgi:hypothetical protein
VDHLQITPLVPWQICLGVYNFAYWPFCNCP